MNRALRRGMNKKHGLHGSTNRRGGGYSAEGAVIPITPTNDWANQTGLGQYAVANRYDDCYWTERPGELYNQPDLAAAQAPMAGGKRRNRSRRGGGCGCGMPRMYGGGCGCSAPSFTGLATMGGRRRTMRTQRAGGTYGFAVDPSQSIGGDGPNVDALHVPVPCDGRMGTVHALNPTFPDSPDPRAPSDLYSLSSGTSVGVTGAEESTLGAGFQSGGRRHRNNRSNRNNRNRNNRSHRRRRGGAYSTPNAYPEECYRGPGSSLPVYNASSAGFTFSPSTDKGVFLPDGVAAFNEVWPVAARVGGGKSRRTKRKNNRNKSRRH